MQPRGNEQEGRAGGYDVPQALLHFRRFWRPPSDGKVEHAVRQRSKAAARAKTRHNLHRHARMIGAIEVAELLEERQT